MKKNILLATSIFGVIGFVALVLRVPAETPKASGIQSAGVEAGENPSRSAQGVTSEDALFERDLAEATTMEVLGEVVALYDNRAVDGNVGITIHVHDAGEINIDTETSGFGSPVISGNAEAVEVGDYIHARGNFTGDIALDGMPESMNIFGEGLFVKRAEHVGHSH